MKDYFNSEISEANTGNETPGFEQDQSYFNRHSLQSTIGVNDWRKPVGPTFN